MKRLFVFALTLFLSIMFVQLCLADTFDLEQDAEASVVDVGCDAVNTMTNQKSVDAHITVQGLMVPRVDLEAQYKHAICSSNIYKMNELKLTTNYVKPKDWTRVIWRLSDTTTPFI